MNFKNLYFKEFLARRPRQPAPQSKAAQIFFQLFASMAIGLGFWYLHWRWMHSLNPDALVFSSIIAAAETLTFLGSILYFYDIWEEKDTPLLQTPDNRQSVDLAGDGPIMVDIFITTVDESEDILAHSLQAARALERPASVETKIYLLDDGNRASMRSLAHSFGATYLSRDSRRGFKAGNLENGLLHSDGDFFVICDADTQLFPSFLVNTLGYFRDKDLSWVQTPHWFYDIPTDQKKGPPRLRKDQSTSRRFVGQITAIFSPRHDPFLSDDTSFFDIIQRRRNRNNASFCCGAASIHRREAVFQVALRTCAKAAEGISCSSHQMQPDQAIRMLRLQPFRYHVSEDLFTSILHHQHGWRSVYHPKIEAKMLSPWSIKAWAAQKLKYAGGTFEIFLFNNLTLHPGLSIWSRLHYLATFWSYLSILWIPILLCAPIFSLLTGVAPVRAYSLEFFIHLLPAMVFGELALMIGLKSIDAFTGRVLAIGTLPICWHALIKVLLGQKPKFKPTPKTVESGMKLVWVRPHIIYLTIALSSILWALYAAHQGFTGFGTLFVSINILWLCWNICLVSRVARIPFWRPETVLSETHTEASLKC